MKIKYRIWLCLLFSVGWASVVHAKLNVVATTSDLGAIAGENGYLVASAGVPIIEVPTTADRAMGDVHPMGNPHFMLDPINGKIVAAHICDRLCQIDAAKCNYYKDNLKDFTKRLDRTLPEWQ